MVMALIVSVLLFVGLRRRGSSSSFAKACAPPSSVCSIAVCISPHAQGGKAPAKADSSSEEVRHAEG